MKNREFKNCMFKLQHPVSYEFNDYECCLIARYVAARAQLVLKGESIKARDIKHLMDGEEDLAYFQTVGKLAKAWEDDKYVDDVRDMFASIDKYHDLQKDAAVLERIETKKSKDVNEYVASRKEVNNE